MVKSWSPLALIAMSDLRRVKSLKGLQESLKSIRNLSTGSLDRLNEPPAPKEQVRTTSLWAPVSISSRRSAFARGVAARPAASCAASRDEVVAGPARQKPIYVKALWFTISPREHTGRGRAQQKPIYPKALFYYPARERRSSVLQGWSVGADDDDDDDDSSDDDAGRSLFEPKLPGARPDMCVASPDPAPCREVTPDDSSGRRVDAPPTRLGPRMPQPPTPSPRVGLAPSLPVVAAPSSGTKRPASPPERPFESGALATSLPQPTADSAARRPPRFRRDLEVVIPAHLLPASKRARGLSNSGSD